MHQPRVQQFDIAFAEIDQLAELPPGMINPVEDICVVFLTQFMPSAQYPIRRKLRSLLNAAVLESRACGVASLQFAN